MQQCTNVCGIVRDRLRDANEVWITSREHFVHISSSLMIRLTLSFSWPEFGRFNVLMIDSLSLGPNLEIQVLITLGPIVCYLLQVLMT